MREVNVSTWIIFRRISLEFRIDGNIELDSWRREGECGSNEFSKIRSIQKGIISNVNL